VPRGRKSGYAPVGMTILLDYLKFIFRAFSLQTMRHPDRSVAKRRDLLFLFRVLTHALKPNSLSTPYGPTEVGPLIQNQTHLKYYRSFLKCGNSMYGVKPVPFRERRRTAGAMIKPKPLSGPDEHSS
jgi:hypothetical protein